MRYLKKMSLIKLCSELIEIIQFHSSQTRPRAGRKRAEAGQESAESHIRNFGPRWDFEECYKYKYLTNFDATVQRAIDLAKQAY